MPLTCLNPDAIKFEGKKKKKKETPKKALTKHNPILCLKMPSIHIASQHICSHGVCFIAIVASITHKSCAS